jgi:hypothetical protein
MDLRGKRRKVPTFAAGAILAAGLVGLLSACAGGSGPEDAYKRLTTVDYGKPYLGMGKAEVLECAGQPRSRIPAGKDTETLVYHYNEPGPVPGSNQPAPKDKKKKKSSSPFSGLKKPEGDYNCTASLTFDKEKLVRVSYAHMNVRSPYAWQSEKDEKKAEQMRREGVPTCTFSLPRCPR